jgi:PAS domain S-box-containing protein
MGCEPPEVRGDVVNDGETARASAWQRGPDRRRPVVIAVNASAELALRESEERWRTLLAHILEMVILVDADGLVTYTSPSVERWLGYATEDLVGNKIATVTAISHVDDALALGSAMDRCEPASPVSLTHRLKARDGSWHWLESTMVCLREDPLVGGVLITSRDVTERWVLEQERERLDLDRRVSQRLEAVGQLAAGIAHEINTPLQFVGDSVTFLKQAVDELVVLTGLYRSTLYTSSPIPIEERRQAMRDAEQNADLEYLCERIPAAFARTADGIARVRSIVLAMKRFSHTSSTELAPADINEAIETTLAVCRSEYKYVAEIVLELSELPPVTCNIGELNQVFLNLIINAAQAIEEKVGDSGERGEIRISTWLDGSDVVFEIADDGPGIPAELQDRIYEPFFTTKEVGKGTGQGLALARNTIERHSGLLQCSSSPGAGATLTVRLPLEQPTGIVDDVQP